MDKNTTALNQEIQIEDSQKEMLEINGSQKSENRTEDLKDYEPENAENQDDQVLGDNQKDYSQLSLNEIIVVFQNMLDKGDQQELYRNAESIKAAFYKVLKREKIASGAFVSVGETTAQDEMETEVSVNPFAELERGFKELYNKYRNDRASFIQELDKEKEDNLVKKLQIIEELKQLLEKAEDVNHTFPAFRELQSRWKSINMVPQAKAKDLWETYQHCVEMFYDYIKINNEFRDLDFKKNLEIKVGICEKAEALENESNVVTAFKELQKLHEEWKELGPVAKEERDAIWERFRNISSVINKKHQHFFEKLKEEQKSNLVLKSQLCEQAEEIANKEVLESNDWNVLSKNMEELQEKWKTIGFAAKKDNQKIYDRFREACDKFYGAKREYYANFKNIMSENLKKKEALCEQAEQLMVSEDWKKATDQLINLQKVWKEVGPVARKQSDAVWKRFRVACDHFFDNKAKHFGAEDEKYEENLKAKTLLLDEIKNFVVKDIKDENIVAMREFQSRWSAIGFVPFKEKEKIQQAFNKVMDDKFVDIRSLDSEKRLNKFKRMVTEAKTSGKGSGLRFERDKLIQKFRKMESDISTLENNMGFFAKSKNADAFIADIQKKIAITREEMAQIEEKIKIIEKQFE